MRHLAPHQPVDRIGKDVEPLFHHQPAEKADHRHVVGETQRAPPVHVAHLRVEDRLVDAARPDADIIAHPLFAQHLRHRIGRRDDRVALAVEAAQDRLEHGLEKRHVVIARIGLEPCMHRSQHRDSVPLRPAHRAVPGAVGAGNVHDIGREPVQVLLDPRRQDGGHAIFGAAGDRQRGQADQVARRLERGGFRGRRIDADLRAVVEQPADQPVERLVRAVAHVIVVAAEQRNAEIGNVHDRPALGPL